MRIRKTMNRGAVLVASAVASGAMVAPLGRLAAQDTPAPPCVECDSTVEARADRQLAEVRARLEHAQQALVDAMNLAMSARDSSGAAAEALAKATGELRRAQQRYEAVTSELVRHRIELERMGTIDRAERNARVASRVSQRLTGYLGVTFSASTRDVQQVGGKTLMRFDDYPTIESVDPDSPAERAGVESGDKLLALNGKDVTAGCEPFSTLLKPGSQLLLRVKRGQYTKQVSALIAKRPASTWAQVWIGPDGWSSTVHVAPAAPSLSSQPVIVSAPRIRTSGSDSSDVEVRVTPISPMPDMPFSRVNGSFLVVAGAEVLPVSNLADYFGVNKGVLVLRVESGTVAARSGLEDGDVIVRAGGRDVTTPSDLSRALYRASESQLQLDVVRLKKRKAILLKWDK